MGIKALRKIQYGAEMVAFGTPAAATAVWRGIGTIQDNRETVFVEEDVGYLLPLNRVYTPKLEAAISFESTPATFEQFPVLMEAGVETVAGVRDGVGSGYLYSYTFPTTAVGVIQAYTIEGGDDAGAERMEYSFVTDFNLSGAAGEAVMMTANWVGRQVAVNAFTAALVPLAVDEIMFSKGIMCIDTVAAVIGTTPITNTLLAMNLDVNTGLIPKYTAEGELYFSFEQHTDPEIVLNLTFEHNASAIAQKVLWRAGTPRQVQLEFRGPALGTPTASETTKRLTIDMAGEWETFDKIGEQNGNDVIQGTFRSGYDATAALGCEVVVVNELAALP